MHGKAPRPGHGGIMGFKGFFHTLIGLIIGFIEGRFSRLGLQAEFSQGRGIVWWMQLLC
jgi:hypothetical protein